MGTLAKRPNECEILVVDDEEEVCLLLEAALKDMCRVVTCRDGKTALSHIEARDFDVVIADLKLPYVSGMDVLRAARKKDDFAELLVITGFASLESAAESIEIGVASYLFKPISITDLRIAVEKAIASRLFHLKSLMLMKHPDVIAPDVKNHIYDITSLFHFSQKLMFSLELPEVMRVILEEINDRFDTLYGVIAIRCQGFDELYAMPRVGVMAMADLRQSILANWENAFSFLNRAAFEKGELPVALFGGRHDAPFSFVTTAPVVLGISVMNKKIGSIALFGKKDFAPSPDDYQFLHVFTSFISSIIEHSYIDMHAKLQARTDGLTGIANHRSFHETLAREIARSDRNHTVFGLILMDMDDFKKINDSHGHLIGDAVIKDLVSRVLSIIRRADTFARYGGEEFGLVLPDTSLEGAQVLAQRICREISSTPFVYPQASVPYSVSIGVSMYDGKQPRLKDSLINDADKALYRSKTAGKSRISVN